MWKRAEVRFMSSVAVRPGKSCPTCSSVQVTRFNMKRVTWTEKEATRASFPESSATALIVLSFKSFLLLFSSVFQILTQSIFYWVWRDRSRRAALLRIHHAVYLFIFISSPAKFHTGNTHLRVFKAHKLGCLIQSSVSVCGRAFWVICVLFDNSFTTLWSHSEKRERRYLKKSRRWKGWPLEIQLDSLPVQQRNSNYTL